MKRIHEAWMLPAAAVSLAAGILLGRCAGGWLLLAGLLASAVAACLCLKGWGRFAAVQAVIIAVGSLMGYGAFHPVLPSEGAYTVSGVVVEELRLREDGQVRTLLSAVTLNGRRLRGGAYWTFYLREGEAVPEGLVPGRRVTMTAEVYHPAGADNPGGYDFREYLLQRNITVGVYGCEEMRSERSWHPMGIAAAVRSKLAGSLVQVMGESAGGYAATMLLGSRNLVPQEEREAFSRLGIAHILSVSGFHVGVLAGIIAGILRKFHAPRRLRFLLTAAALAAYAWLTGLQTPVVRAACLFLLYEFGALKHRQRSRLHLFSASWVLQLLFSPVQVTSISFHLTYGAVLGLTLVTPWMQAQRSPRRGQRQWRALCASIGAQLGILLPQLYWFHELPLAAILLNIVVIGASTVLLVLGWAVLLLCPVPPLAAVLGRLTAFLFDGMLIGVRALGDVPGIALWTAQANLATAICWALLLMSMSWWWPLRRRWPALLTGVVLLGLSVCPMPHRGVEYVQLSVGEADAAILRDDALTIAIDTGQDGEALADYLHQRRLGLDRLIITHLHSDHAGGIRALLDERIPVKVCYLPWGALDALVDPGAIQLLDELKAAGTEVVFVSRGDVIDLPHGNLTALWPEAGKVRLAQDANESCLVLRAQLYGSTMLLASDLEGDYEMYAAAPADILKAAHHGSESSSTPAFLEAVAPQLLVLSCGQAERVASMDARRGSIPMADTCTQGAVMIKFDASGFTVETMR